MKLINKDDRTEVLLTVQKGVFALALPGVVAGDIPEVKNINGNKIYISSHINKGNIKKLQSQYDYILTDYSDGMAQYLYTNNVPHIIAKYEEYSLFNINIEYVPNIRVGILLEKNDLINDIFMNRVIKLNSDKDEFYCHIFTTNGKEDYI